MRGVSAPVVSEPCIPLPVRALPRRDRVPVVEVLATGGVGGAQQHVASLVERLDRARFVPHVVALSDGPAVRRIEAAGVPVTVLHDRNDESAIAALTALLADLAPAVVHGHMYRAEVVATQAVLRAAADGLPRPFLVSTVHSSRVRRAPERALLARLTPEMDRLIAVSESIAAKIRREGRRGAPVVVVPNGVDLGQPPDPSVSRRLKVELGLPPDAPCVGVIARIEPEKGHPTLLAAWPRVLAAEPEARLLIVGEGSQQVRLHDSAAQLGLLGPSPRVLFTGRRDDVAAILAVLDVAVLPSYREAQGISLLEAMALARPIVASAVGGIPEFVTDGQTGLLVPPRDPAALAGALLRVLADRGLAARLGRNARELVREHYCLDHMVRRVEELYEEGIAAHAALEVLQRRSA
jgi:glycosyltransferase involved in cell wall biosynthesis